MGDAINCGKADGETCNDMIGVGGKSNLGVMVVLGAVK